MITFYSVTSYFFSFNYSYNEIKSGIFGASFSLAGNTSYILINVSFSMISLLLGLFLLRVFLILLWVNSPNFG